MQRLHTHFPESPTTVHLLLTPASEEVFGYYPGLLQSRTSDTHEKPSPSIRKNTSYPWRIAGPS